MTAPTHWCKVARMGANATVAAIISSLAWPIILIVALVLFRDSVKDLLKRLSKLKAGGNELVFSEELKKLAESVEGADSEAAPDQVSDEQSASKFDVDTGVAKSAGDPSLDLAKVAKVASESPAGAVLLAWQQVEQCVDAVFSSQYGLGVGRAARVTPTLRKIERLYSDRVITSTLFDQLNSLRKLRNVAVHGTQELNATEAIKFAELANEVIAELEEARGGIEAAHSYVRDARRAIDRVCDNKGVVSDVPTDDGGSELVVNLDVEPSVKPIHVEIVYSPGIQTGTLSAIRTLLRSESSPRPLLILTNHDFVHPMIQRQLAEVPSPEGVHPVRWRTPEDDEAVREALNSILSSLGAAPAL